MAVLYCECGYKIWSELWWRESRELLLYFDDLEISETYGERVTRCPECGREFGLEALKPGSAGERRGH